ncbi:MAG TPA: mechanosensitive ion channel family protein, partial [Lacipirellula sp.]
PPVATAVVDAASAATTVAPIATPATAAAPQAAAPPDMLEQLSDFLDRLDKTSPQYIAIELALHAALVLIICISAWTLSSWGSAIVRAAFDRIKFDETLSIFIAKLVRWAILALAGLTCLSFFGVEATSFAALVGAAGLAIGLAFQGTLSNFAAGAMLLVFRPYKVNDDVNVAGYSGTVREIELFTTIIDTHDNRRIIVPNSSIFGAVIENVTHNPMRRFSVNVGAAYSADIDETRRALERAVKSVPAVLTNPEPAVALVELAASSVNWTVRGWAMKEYFGQAQQDVIRAVKLELDAAGIGIPYPQLELHLDQPAAAQKSRLAA